MFTRSAVILLLAVFCPSAPAGQLTLKNGDRITGTIVRSDGKTVTIKSTYAGEINVAMSAVESIVSDEPLAVATADGSTVVGPVATECGTLAVNSAPARSVSVPLAAVAALRSKAEQALFERRRDAEIYQLWSGTVDTGFSLTRGNSDTTTFTAGLNATRQTAKDKITVYATNVFARNSTSGTAITSASAVRGGARYDVNVSDRVFMFGSLDLEHDRLQRLDLRSVLGSGFGWHARKSERTNLDVFGGATLDRENFDTQPDRTTSEALVGQELSHKLASRMTVRQRLAFYPNLNDSGEFRLNVDTTAVTPITKWIGVQVTVSNRYVSGVEAPGHRNDVLVATGLRFTFAD
jgi:putative salt-induced outer membrane protein YdiY